MGFMELTCPVKFSEEEILKYAASVETPSEHPIATAIVKEASNRNITVPSVSNFEATE